MENIKIKMLSFIQASVNVLLVVSVLTFVLSGVITIFYTEINTIFETLGWSQERFAWLTVSVGSLGSLGLISTRLTGTLKSALVLAKQDNNIQLSTNQRLNDTKFETQQKINEQLREQMQLNNDQNISEMKATREAIELQNEFNRLQAQKYVEAPDNLVDPELKDKYKKYLAKKPKV